MRPDFIMLSVSPTRVTASIAIGRELFPACCAILLRLEPACGRPTRPIAIPIGPRLLASARAKDLDSCS